MKRILFAACAVLAAACLPAAAQAANAYSTANVNMRSGPSTAYPPVAVVPAGAPVTIHGCLDAWSWCDTSWGPNRGWVSASYLEAMYQSRRVRVHQYAPSIGLPVISFHFGNYWDRHYRNRSFYRERSRWQGYDRDRRGGYSRGRDDRRGSYSRGSDDHRGDNHHTRNNRRHESGDERRRR